MLETENLTRNMSADNSRIEFWGENPTLRKIFSTQEYHTLFWFLRAQWVALLLLAIISFGLAFLEGGKAVALIGIIKGFVASEADITKLLTISLFGKSLHLDREFVVGSRLGLIFIAVAFFLLLTILTGGTKLFNTWLTKRVQLGLMRDVRRKTLDKMLSFDLEYFNQARSGELIFLMNTETSRFSLIITFASRFVTFGVQTLIFSFMLFYLFWDLSLIVFASAVAFFFAHLRVDIRVKMRSWESNLSENRLSQFFHQIVYGIKMIKIGAMEQRERNRYFEEHKKFESHDLATALLNGLSAMSQEMAMAFILIMVLVYVYYSKDMSNLLTRPDQILAYLFLLVRAIPAGVGLQQSRSAMIGSYGPLARVMALLHKEDGPDKTVIEITGVEKPELSIKGLACSRVSFSYNGRENALSDVNLEFYLGTMSALVGFSGSGKSTIMDVLSFIRQPRSGEIKVNDRSLKPGELSSYKHLVGYMNQEPIIFHDTIRANVKYFKPDASDEEIWEALRLAAADEFIRQLPGELDTGMGERGVTVSGGERQRIGLARVFLQNPPILLLDEATNALDYRTEGQVYRNLESLKHDRIIVVAAHRLSAIRDFENIVVLHKGQVVEQGTHPELMRRGSIYYNLYMVQEQTAHTEAYN